MKYAFIFLEYQVQAAHWHCRALRKRLSECGSESCVNLKELRKIKIKMRVHLWCRWLWNARVHLFIFLFFVVNTVKNDELHRHHHYHHKNFHCYFKTYISRPRTSSCACIASCILLYKQFHGIVSISCSHLFRFFLFCFVLELRTLRIIYRLVFTICSSSIYYHSDDHLCVQRFFLLKYSN